MVHDSETSTNSVNNINHLNESAGRVLPTLPEIDATQEEVPSLSTLRSRDS